MIITRTPFRLPLGGGGTDLPDYYENHGGFLITAAINKYMIININRPAMIDKIKVSYTKTEIVNHPDELQHELVRESLKLLKVNDRIEIHSLADLSGGTGMGSSSSYTVGLLNGLNTVVRNHLSTYQLAEQACHLEIHRAGKPIGKQDQYAAAFGGIIQLEINREGKVRVTPLRLHTEIISDLEYNLMIFYTNIQRDANTILSEQSSKADRADEIVLNCMHQIKEIGHKSKEALVSGEIDKFGALLHEHWLVKKNISSRMSNPQIDRWYDIAMNSGALGGKIMGAGGGGFLMFCVNNGHRRRLRAELEKNGLKYMPYHFDFEGSKVLSNF